MTARRLTTLRVDKPWGRHDLWPGFDDVATGGAPVGEIWFDEGLESDPSLLVKYLFTCERLSVQVHPDDAAARLAGHPRGKEEMWLVLAAAPESTIALGLREATTKAALRTAALDGSIVDLLDWRSVAAGDVIYSPAGTIHAIGAGITLIEVQQNIDLTYRLFDYGRPRPLHLDAGLAVSDLVPFVAPLIPGPIAAGRAILCEGRKFVVERWTWGGMRTVTTPGPAWLVPVSGGGTIDDAPFAAGEAWLIEGVSDIALNGDALFAYDGPDRLALFGSP